MVSESELKSGQQAEFNGRLVKITGVSDPQQPGGPKLFQIEGVQEGTGGNTVASTRFRPRFVTASALKAASGSSQAFKAPERISTELSQTPEGRDVIQRFSASGQLIKETVRKKTITKTIPFRTSSEITKEKKGEAVSKFRPLPSFDVRLPSGARVTASEGSRVTDPVTGQKFTISARGTPVKAVRQGIDINKIKAFDNTKPPSFLKGGKKIGEDFDPSTGGKLNVFLNKEGTQVVRINRFGQSVGTSSAIGLKDVKGMGLPLKGEAKIVKKAVVSSASVPTPTKIIPAEDLPLSDFPTLRRQPDPASFIFGIGKGSLLEQEAILKRKTTKERIASAIPLIKEARGLREATKDIFIVGAFAGLPASFAELGAGLFATGQELITSPLARQTAFQELSLGQKSLLKKVPRDIFGFPMATVGRIQDPEVQKGFVETVALGTIAQLGLPFAKGIGKKVAGKLPKAKVTAPKIKVDSILRIDKVVKGKPSEFTVTGLKPATTTTTFGRFQATFEQTITNIFGRRTPVKTGVGVRLQAKEIKGALEVRVETVKGVTKVRPLPFSEAKIQVTSRGIARAKGEIIPLETLGKAQPVTLIQAPTQILTVGKGFKVKLPAPLKFKEGFITRGITTLFPKAGKGVRQPPSITAGGELFRTTRTLAPPPLREIGSGRLVQGITRAGRPKFEESFFEISTRTPKGVTSKGTLRVIDVTRQTARGDFGTGLLSPTGKTGVGVGTRGGAIQIIGLKTTLLAKSGLVGESGNLFAKGLTIQKTQVAKAIQQVSQRQTASIVKGFEGFSQIGATITRTASIPFFKEPPARQLQPLVQRQAQRQTQTFAQIEKESASLISPQITIQVPEQRFATRQRATAIQVQRTLKPTRTIIEPIFAPITKLRPILEPIQTPKTKQPAIQVPRQEPILRPIQDQPQISIPKQPARQLIPQIQIPLQPVFGRPPTPTSRLPPATPPPFFIPPLPFFGGIRSRGTRAKRTITRQPRKFTPSFTAVVFGIRGKPIKGLLTGFEIRPIPIMGFDKKKKKKKKGFEFL